MNQLTLEIIGDHSAQRRALIETLSTLPRSFAVDEPAELAAVCAGDEWVASVHEAIRRGSRGVVVMEPSPADPDSVSALAAAAGEAGVPVRLARRWACHPAVTALREAPLDAGSTVWIDSHTIVGDRTPLVDALSAQLDVLSSLFGSSVQAQDCVITADAYLATGRLARAASSDPIQVAGSRSTAAPTRIRVRELLARGRRALHLPEGTSAAPGRADVSDAAGRVVLPSHYETGYRAVWRSLYAQLRDGEVDTADLEHFAQVQRAAQHLCRQAGH